MVCPFREVHQYFDGSPVTVCSGFLIPSIFRLQRELVVRHFISGQGLKLVAHQFNDEFRRLLIRAADILAHHTATNKFDIGVVAVFVCLSGLNIHVPSLGEDADIRTAHACSGDHSKVSGMSTTSPNLLQQKQRIAAIRGVGPAPFH